MLSGKKVLFTASLLTDSLPNLLCTLVFVFLGEVNSWYNDCVHVVTSCDPEL